MIARYKHSSLFGLIVSNEEKKEVFMTLSPGPQWWIRFPAKLSLLHLQMDQEIAKSLQIYFNLTFCVTLPVW